MEVKSDDNLLMEKETYNGLLNERMNEIKEISEKSEYNNLVYYFKSKDSGKINFIKFKSPFALFRDIRDGDISLTNAEKEQENFKTYLGQTTSGNPNYKEKYQLDTIKSVKNLYYSRQEIIDLFNDYLKIRSNSIYWSKQDETKGTGLKILTLKQMLQRLPIALEQVKEKN